jgi:citrate lyase subunit beta / citryl-CoA lyase
MGLHNPGPAWLFCPADRPERYQKAAAAADIVILDLEDGCAAADRPAARQALVDVRLDPARTLVRVNQFGTADQQLDLEALKKTPYDTVMLPKCEAAEQVSALAPLHVIVLVESPMGALVVAETVSVDNAVAAMWGAEDLFSVYLDIKDLDGLRAEADDAVAVGFDAKVAIHPSQLPVIRAAYAPSADQVHWARDVLVAAADERGVFAFEGKMVDAPVLRRAERIVQLAADTGR